MDKLIRKLFKNKTSRDMIIDPIPLLRSAASFIVDASVETNFFAACDGVLTNLTERVLCREFWSGDIQSKVRCVLLP